MSRPKKETLAAAIERVTKEIREEGRQKGAAAAAELRVELEALRTACDDAHGVAEDMLAPVRKRTLGHVQHVSIYQGARASILSGLAYLAKLITKPEPNAPPK